MSEWYHEWKNSKGLNFNSFPVQYWIIIVAAELVASGLYLIFLQVAAAHVRYLNLLEYQSKALLESSGVAIQQFRVVENTEQVKQLTQNFSE
jgi:hypothetical protein